RPTDPQISWGYYYHTYEGSQRKNTIAWGSAGVGKIPRWGIGGRRPRAVCSARLKRRHHVTREPAELLLELLGGDALGPVDHELIEARVLGLDGFDRLDYLRGRAQQPRLLLDDVLEGWREHGCSRWGGRYTQVISRRR